MSRAKKVRVGRPPLPEGRAKGRVFSFRITLAEWQAIECAARDAKQTPAEWARSVLIKETGGTSPSR